MNKPASIELPNGDRYVATVLVVTKSDGRGPREFRILRTDESVNVADGMEFWIAYVKEEVINAARPN